MTRTLDFPPELENRLQVLAAQNGTSVEAFILRAVEVAADAAQPAQQLSGFGAAAHLTPRAAGVNRDRHEEIDDNGQSITSKQPSLSSFLSQATALDELLQAAGFGGADAADLLAAVRAERAAR